MSFKFAIYNVYISQITQIIRKLSLFLGIGGNEWIGNRCRYRWKFDIDAALHDLDVSIVCEPKDRNLVNI